MNDLDFLLPRFRLHLDEQLRLNELGQAIRNAFSYEDIVGNIYKDEHTEFLETFKTSILQAHEEQRQADAAQIEELQRQLEFLSTSKQNHDDTSHRHKSSKPKKKKTISEVPSTLEHLERRAQKVKAEKLKSRPHFSFVKYKGSDTDSD